MSTSKLSNDSTITRASIPLDEHPLLQRWHRETTQSALKERRKIPLFPIRVKVFPYRGYFGKISVSRRQILLYLHPLTLSAPPEVFRALINCLAARLSRLRPSEADISALRTFIQNLPTEQRSAEPARLARGTSPRGDHHDLAEIYREVNAEWFDDQVTARVEWMARRAFRKLADYRHEEGLIRVSPILDHPDVPRRYLEFLMYHEMLHAFLGSREAGKRRIYHHRRFRKLEQSHPNYPEALHFERTVLPKFRRRRRS